MSEGEDPEVLNGEQPLQVFEEPVGGWVEDLEDLGARILDCVVEAPGEGIPVWGPMQVLDPEEDVPWVE